MVNCAPSVSQSIMIYLDNNATTQVAPEVFEEMAPFLKASYGNPSSAHEFGRSVRGAVETARERVAALLRASSPDEIVFTSSGTESDNWAIRGAIEARPGKRHIVTTTVEHEAVRKTCEAMARLGLGVTLLDVDQSGELGLDKVRNAVTEGTAVVSVMLANNETGILFPVESIAEIIKERSDALVHVDAVNAAGKVRINLEKSNIDLLSISAHKFHGPKGVGALYIRRGVDIPSLIFGGGQEGGRRAGTEAVHQIVGLGKAAEMARDISQTEKIRMLRDHLENEILNRIPNSRINGTSDPGKRLPNTSNISFVDTNGEAILARLNDIGVCVSTGSACNANDHSASPVLQAMNIPYRDAMGAIRFSVGRYNTREEVDFVLERLPRIITELRSMAA